MAPAAARVPRNRARYGIGEWYGKSFSKLTPTERHALAGITVTPGGFKTQTCIPRSRPGKTILRNKPSGICSIRIYEEAAASGHVGIAPGMKGALCTVCPSRFEERGLVYSWIGETLLGCPNPQIAGEIPFLERLPLRNPAAAESAEEADAVGKPVGRIDAVLVHPDKSDPMAWCALEKQAVYFSGKGMAAEFNNIARHTGQGLPFPTTTRRPDWRSSGPKRLMPQLQVKVPTLRRWGKKMAVLVDEAFFYALDEMESVGHVSNCDIAWFVVRYDEAGGEASLQPGSVHYTTLESAVEGLTAGKPVSLDIFETRIREKMMARARGLLKEAMTDRG